MFNAHRAEIFRLVAKHAAYPEWQSRLALVATPGQSDNVLALESPYGKGRIIFSPRIGETGSYGQFLVQKLELDAKDENYWKTVWILTTDINDKITLGDGRDVINMRSPYRDQYSEMTLAIAAALGK